MNAKRLRKQIVYAAIYGIFWLILFSVPALIVLPPAGPRPTPTANPTVAPQPIDIQSVEVIQHEATIDVVARLHNPNARLGIAHYPVHFILFNDAGAQISRVPVVSHILPGSLQYISALNIPVIDPIAKVTLETPPDPLYANLAPAMPLPSFSTYLRERQTRSVGGQNITEQKGLVTNASSLDWQHVEVTALALDASDRLIGVGKTFVGRLTSGEQREFTIQWPASALVIAQVATLATTNIFQEDNFIRAVGDPALLR